MNSRQKLRIGEAARRLGMSPELLRAWETRYGIPTPERTAGGLRVYPEPELERLRSMRDLVNDGMAPAEAARAVEAAAPAPAAPAAAPPVALPAIGELEPLAAELAARLEAFDDGGAQAVLDQLLAGFSAEIVIGDVILPTLRRVGDRWAAGEVTVAQEHFASTLLRGRLLALARGWDRGVGPRAVLACPSGELHDIGLVSFGLALRTHGWRITYLGQDTPLGTLMSAIERLAPAAVVLAATTEETLTQIEPELRRVAERSALYMGGRGAVDGRLPGTVLPSDPADAARAVVRTHRP